MKLKAMTSRLETIVARIENSTAPFGAWLLTVLSIIAVRILIENFSSNRLSNSSADFYTALVHYPLFYLTALLGTTTLLSVFSREPISRASRLAAAGLMAIWLAPLFDLALQALGTEAYRQAYIVTDWQNLAYAFFSFFGPLRGEGITPGIRLEIAIILIAVFLYVKVKTAKTTQALLAAVSVYAFLFFLVSLPSFVLLGHQILAAQPYIDRGLNQVFAEIFSATPVLPDTLFVSVSQSRLQDFKTFIEGWNRFFSYFYLMMIAAAMAVWFRLLDRAKSSAFWRNCRPERIVYYFVLTLIGMMVAGGTSAPLGLGFVISLITLFIALACSWLLQVHINDKFDQEIDRLSNASRPLIQGTLSPYDYQNINYVLGFLILWGGASLGWEILFLLLVFNGVLYIYSAPPLRLRRFFPLANGFIGLAGTAAVLMGYVIISGKSFITFPAAALAAIFIFLSVISVVKDFKDMAGDSQANVKTLFTIYGEKTGVLIFTGLLGLVSVMLGAAFKSLSTGLIALVGAAAAYMIFRQKPYKEKRLFLVFFLAVLVVLLTKKI